MICSSYRALHDKNSKLKQIFWSNGYPKNFAGRCIKTYLDKIFIKSHFFCTVLKQGLVKVFPFFGKRSLEIKNRLLNSTERTLPYCKLNIVFKSPAKIVNQFCFKNVLPRKFCSGIVYNFKRNSSKAIYYGKTKRQFYVRAAKRMGILHLTNKRVKKMLNSQLFQITY